MLSAGIHLPQNTPRIHRHEISWNGRRIEHRGGAYMGLDVAEDFSLKLASHETRLQQQPLGIGNAEKERLARWRPSIDISVVTDRGDHGHEYSFSNHSQSERSRHLYRW